MRFEPGINCVVGPNGSGKSNVVDALAWVMGEQGVKNLRGASMADVIFAGTTARPALGRAEVALTIDNTDGVLPIDYTEVTISRTLFRSGGSEYAINGTACRLLDIQELLSDTGMGREMHVIIGQGRLDQVLTATPEDRRGFVEEAAGVLKHRRRKERTLRKLDAMAASFTRVEDLTAELRRQLGPLAKQAEAARRAQVVQAIERDAKARILADDIAQQQARLAAEDVDEAELLQTRENLQRRINHAREEVQALEVAEAEASPELARMASLYERLLGVEERFRSLDQLAEERVRSLVAIQGGYHGESPDEIRERAATARKEEEDLQVAVHEGADALAEVVSEREFCEENEHKIEVELATANRVLADRREESARAVAKLAGARSRMEALEAEAERVEMAWMAADERARESSEQCARLEEEIVADSSGQESLGRQHEENSARLAQTSEALDIARKKEQSAREALASWTATADALALSLEPEDASAWAEHEGVGTLVAQKIRATAGWESALEAALEGAAGGIAVHGLDCAVDVVRGVREAEAGRLHVIVGADENEDFPAHRANKIWAEQARQSAQTALEMLGVGRHTDATEGKGGEEAVLAEDVLEADEDILDALRHLLAGVVLAADTTLARELVKAGAWRAVTTSGDIFGAYATSGGNKVANSLLARQRSYSQAREKEEAAGKTLEVARKRVERLREEFSRAQDAYEDSGAKLAAHDSVLAASSAKLGALRQALASAKSEVERALERRKGIARERENQQRTTSELEAAVELIGVDPQDVNTRIEELSVALSGAHEATRQARIRETEARLNLRTREERLRAILGRADSLERSARAAAERIEREARLAARRSEAGARASRVGEIARRALAEAGARRTSLDRARVHAQEAMTERSRALRSARTGLDDLTEQLRHLEDEAHRQELARAEIRLRLEQLEARAREELGMEASVLVEEFGPHIPVPVEEGSLPFVREEQEQRLARARRDLARLGKINPLALEEHAALEERQKYLAGQLADLKKSREDLLRLVRDLDTQLDAVLRSALADVSEAFGRVFSMLFPGGEGRLVLTDPDSPLTTGIDIEARPPGKKVKRLSLLSGGERSLTAIAFLVAIFMARPSPFYVMDEVEAALDDVNLSRLLTIFRELQNSSQLLVVTHQKRTMEIADCLYGVTMREGVTEVISQRMSELVPLVED